MLLRRVIPTAFALLALIPSVAAAVSARQPGDRPNILFIMVDDLGKEWVSCYGAEEIETPHLDALAAGGMKFHNAYSMPQCTPTRATLLTGQYPWRNGWCNHWDVPRWGAGCHFDWKCNTTFARQLKKTGYATAAAGKWQINDFRVTPDAMGKHGFDEWCMWTGYETGNPPSGARYWDPYINTNKGSRTYEGRFGCDVFVDFLIDFIERHQDQPMMLYFPMALTHGPLVSTPAEPDASDKMAKHKAMVRYTDAALGRLVAAIDKLKIRNNTIIIWSTDNGTSGGISGRMNGRLVRGGKAKLTENGVCEPYIVNCPGLVPAGVETDALTDFTDLFPTFCELAGAELPEGVAIDGKSIAPVMLGKDKDGPRDWIMALGHGAARLDERGVRPKVDYTPRVIRDRRYKAFVQDGQITKLVDLKTDLEEQHDLSGNEEASAIAARKKFEAVVSTCPEKDARPQYEPTPPRPWDRKPTDDSGKKVKRNKKRDRRAKKLRTGE